MKSAEHEIHFELIDLCRQGDRKAQYEIYKLYVKAMLNTAFRIVGEKQAAEDVVQDSFIKAFNNLYAFEGRSRFGAWLKRIVVNESLQVIKKNKFEWVGEEEIVDHYDNEDESYLDDVDVIRVKKCLEELPEGFRVVLSLYLIEGYDHNEIGEILGISPNTSKTQYMRGKKKLKESILNHQRDER
ncbi:RNA polymerase sigma factor [Marinigracilibium pacificum]|uniref:RNA polymerase sigma factor n=1 Tax=Marinigracilibium pacificum TaxID=2729599 RepID=A0A848J8A4_9BACT|nr:RNA polymerase sigma factor [Marinigracilibium pacificum]NMM50609.1 RNA polymerase sigma factor [Marinigracilibium pacificum]